MWKDILKTAAVLGAMFLGSVVLIGFVVPREHAVRCEALIQKRPKDVWESLTDIQGWSAWMPGVDYVVALRDRGERSAYQVIGPAGSVEVELQESEQPARLVVSTTGKGFTRRRTYTLETLRDLTQVTVDESADRENPFERGMTVFEDHHDDLLETLSALAIHLGVNTIPEIVKM